MPKRKAVATTSVGGSQSSPTTPSNSTSESKACSNGTLLTRCCTEKQAVSPDTLRRSVRLEARAPALEEVRIPLVSLLINMC